MSMHASGGDERRPSGAAAALLVLLLCALALGLRARGLGFSLPHATHADGRVLVDQIAALRAGAPDPEGHRLYPHLLPRAAALFGEPGEIPAAPAASAAEHRARASGPWLRARWVSLAFSLPLVPLTYLLARALLSRPGALFAAALSATSLLHLSFAQQERPHAALASTTALAVLLAVHLRRRPGWGSYALAGLGAGLAVGALHSGLAALPPLVAAHLLRRREAGARPAGALRLALPLVLVGLALVWFYPFHAGDLGGGLGRASDPGAEDQRQNLQVEEQGDERVFNLSGHFVKLEAFDGSGFEAVAGTFYSYDPLLAALLALGLASFLVRRPRADARMRADALVLAAYALPYLLAIGLYGKTPERFVMPLTPFAAIVAARGAAVFAPRRPRTAWLAALALLGVPTALAWRLGSLRSADDTYTRAAGWIEAELSADERVALLLDPYQDLPLIQTPAAAAVNAAWPWPSRWAEYQAAQPALPPGRDLRVARVPGRKPGELAERPLLLLAELGARYAVVELVAAGPKSAIQRAVHEALAATGEPLWRVSPLRADAGGNERLFIRSSSWKQPMFLRVLQARCAGPTIEIYRLSDL